MIRLYVKSIFIVLSAMFFIGFVLPFLFSAASSVAVSFGIGLIIVGLPIYGWYTSNTIKGWRKYYEEIVNRRNGSDGNGNDGMQ